jgi:two-component system, NtrC family, sensor kinase
VRSTLRSQFVAIVAPTVAAVLVASHWMDEEAVSRVLQRDLEERARLVLLSAAHFWESTDVGEVHGHLMSLMQARRQIAAIDVFEIRDSVRCLTSTREDVPPADVLLDAGAVDQLKMNKTVRTRLPERSGVVPWRLAMPVEQGGAVVGAVQVEALPTRLRETMGGLHHAHIALVIGSVVVLSLVLTWLLERRVARPVRALKRTMEQARRGDLCVRAAVDSTNEVGFLADGFNDMLTQIENFTTGLQARVEEATRDLAAKNLELQDLNEKLDRAQHEAARRQPLAAAGQIASTIAHELGTPLNSILGYTQLLLRQEMASDQKAKLSIIESQIRRMIETIQGILDRTRRHLVPRAPVEIASLVDEALAFVSQRITEAELSVKTEIPSELSLFQGDAVGLRQILVNLLTNAIHATDPKGTITVKAAVVPRATDQASQLEIDVSDTGKGLQPDELERVFEPFYTTKEPGVGTGLGLAIVSQIASDHGGRVFAESEPGRGTTIRVQLPLET